MLRRAFTAFTLSAGLGWMLVQGARATTCPDTTTDGAWILRFESVTHEGLLDAPKEDAEAERWRARGDGRFTTQGRDAFIVTWDDGTFAETL